MDNIKKRKANVELLRILAMLLIVSHHFAVHGEFEIEKMGINGVIVSVLGIGGKIGVNIFFLISGFYSSAKDFPIKKIFKLCDVTVFYSIVLYIISVFVGVVELRKKEIVYALFPQFFGKGYWFVIIYLEICILMPILNRVFDEVRKEEIQVIIMVMMTLFCIFPQLMSSSLKVNDFGFSTLGWYILVYLVGAYLQRYGCYLYWSKIWTWTGLILSLSVFGSANIVRVLIEMGILDIEKGVLFKIIQISSNDSASGILPVIISLLIFICFQSIDVGNNKYICKISATTFGIYLLHDNKNFSQYLWVNICRTKKMMSSPYFLLYALCCILGVFVVCSIAEYMRNFVVEKIRENLGR